MLKNILLIHIFKTYKKKGFTMKRFLLAVNVISLIFGVCIPSFSQLVKSEKELAKLEKKYNKVLLEFQASDKSEKDNLKANKNMLKLAEQGYTPAMRFLGTYYYKKITMLNMKTGMSKQRKTETR